MERRGRRNHHARQPTTTRTLPWWCEDKLQQRHTALVTMLVFLQHQMTNTRVYSPTAHSSTKIDTDKKKTEQLQRDLKHWYNFTRLPFYASGPCGLLVTRSAVLTTMSIQLWSKRKARQTIPSINLNNEQLFSIIIIIIYFIINKFCTKL
jgi:hypothetical protein